MSIVAETINFLLSTGNSGNIGNESEKTEEKAQKAVPILGKRTGNNGNTPIKTEKEAAHIPDTGEACAGTIAQAHGLTLADLQQAAGPDWAEIKNDPATLEALVHSITIRRMRERGEVPPDYTTTTVCRHCGPVPIYQGIAERVLGCPWCFNRAKGLPMPKAPTKTQVQDLGPAMIKREGCTGNSPWDYFPSDKVRIGQLIPCNERGDEPGGDT